MAHRHAGAARSGDRGAGYFRSFSIKASMFSKNKALIGVPVVWQALAGLTAAKQSLSNPSVLVFGL